jgi:hypothetical protein
MKSIFFIPGLLLSSLAFSQVDAEDLAREKRIKKEMVERVEALIQKASIVEMSMKKYKKDEVTKTDYKKACDTVKEIFEMYREHMNAIGGNLDLFNRNTTELKQTAKNELIVIHQMYSICGEGKSYQYVDARNMAGAFKGIGLSLKHQKNQISNADMSFENDFIFENEY